MNEKYWGNYLNSRGTWPLLLSGWGAIIYGFSLNYRGQGALYWAAILSYGWYAVCFCLLVLCSRTIPIAHSRSLFNLPKPFPVKGLIFLALSIVISGLMLLSEMMITRGLAEVELTALRTTAETHYVLLLNEFWSRLMQLTFIQWTWLFLFFAIHAMQARYQTWVAQLGISHELHQALFRIQAGYVGEAFISKTLLRVADIAERDPQKAEQIVESMGELMRYTLETTQRDKIQAQSEIGALRCYLQVLNETYLLQNSDFQLEVDANLCHQTLLPLSLLGLVAHTLGKLFEHGQFDTSWKMKIALTLQHEHIVMVIHCFSADELTALQQGELVSCINNEVLDNMRFRLEQVYQVGSFIDFTTDNGIMLTVTLPQTTGVS